DRPALWLEQAEQRPSRRRLAASGFAGEREDLSLVQREVDAVDGLRVGTLLAHQPGDQSDAGGEVHLEVVDLDDRFAELERFRPCRLCIGHDPTDSKLGAPATWTHAARRPGPASHSSGTTV